MTDTNQLREAFEVRMTDGGKWPAAVERGRGGAYRLAQTENAWTEWQACAESLQARAQAQGVPVGMVQVGWQQRYICPEEGPSSWQDTCSATAAILAKKANHEVRATYAFSTTPQPAQATQADVTDDQIISIAAQWSNKEFAEGAWRFCTDFARAILALRTERVPMTDDERNDMICTVTTLCAKLSRQAIAGMAIDWTEAHHGITAQAKKEGA